MLIPTEVVLCFLQIMVLFSQGHQAFKDQKVLMDLQEAQVFQGHLDLQVGAEKYQIGKSLFG